MSIRCLLLKEHEYKLTNEMLFAARHTPLSRPVFDYSRLVPLRTSSALLRPILY